MKDEITGLSEKELIEWSLKFKVSVEEIKCLFIKMGSAGIKDAEAGKQLGIQFRKLQEKEKNETSN